MSISKSSILPLLLASSLAALANPVPVCTQMRKGVDPANGATKVKSNPALPLSEDTVYRLRSALNIEGSLVQTLAHIQDPFGEGFRAEFNLADRAAARTFSQKLAKTWGLAEKKPDTVGNLQFSIDLKGEFESATVIASGSSVYFICSKN